MAELKVAQFVLLVISAPLVRGTIARLKALLQRRRGASIWRPYADLWKLFHKEDIVLPSASWMFRASPRLAFSLTLTAAAFVPVVLAGGLLSFSGDFILLVYLLGFSRFVMMLGALDTGSSFAGMGASREAMVSALSEAPLLLCLTAVAIAARSSSITGIVSWTRTQDFMDISGVHVLAITGFVFVLLAEAGRMPVDNPVTHLELTMLHEAMVLEYSGPSLALIEWGHAIKLNLLAGTMIALFAPWGVAMTAGVVPVTVALLLYGMKITLVVVAIALLESTVAKMRMYAVPEFLGIASGLSILAIVFTVILKR